jgi:hypothetical protein
MEADIALDYDFISAAHGRTVLLLARIRARSGTQPSRTAADGTENSRPVAARNLAVTVTGRARLLRQVSAYREIQEGNQTIYRLEDLRQDERKNLLVQLSIPPHDRLGEAEIARLRFDFDEADGSKLVHRTIEQTVVVKYVSESEAAQQPPDSKVVKADLLFEAMHAREEAKRAAQRHDFQMAVTLLTTAAETIEVANLWDTEVQAEDQELRHEAEEMEREGRAYAAAHPQGRDTSQVPATSPLPTRATETRVAVERNGATPRIVKWKGSSLRLTMDVLRFGRADDNDLCLPDEEVSRYHCQVVREGEHLVLYDLNSRNGTFANGGLVTGPFRLSAGDLVTLGSWLFRFE